MREAMMMLTTMPLSTATIAIALMKRGVVPVSRSNTSAMGASDAASSAGPTAISATHITST